MALEDPAAWIARLGSFWAEVYAGRAQLDALTQALLQRYQALERQAGAVALRTDVARCAAVQTFPVTPLPLAPPVVLARYGQGRVHGDGLAYGDPGPVAYPAGGLLECAALADRILRPTRVWTPGVDCWLADGWLYLDAPLDLPVLWVLEGQYPGRGLSDQAALLRAPGGPDDAPHRQALEARREAAWGRSRAAVRRVLEAATGVPAAAADEAVLRVIEDPGGTHLETATMLYPVPRGTASAVTAGQAVTPAWEIAAVCTWDAVALGPGLARTPGVLLPATALPLTPAPLRPESDQPGWDAFWAAADAAALAAALDTRAQPSGPPTAADLPATLDPLALAATSYWDTSATFIRIDLAACGPRAALRHLATMPDVIPLGSLVLVEIRDPLSPPEAPAATDPTAPGAPGAGAALEPATVAGFADDRTIGLTRTHALACG